VTFHSSRHPSTGWIRRCTVLSLLSDCDPGEPSLPSPEPLALPLLPGVPASCPPPLPMALPLLMPPFPAAPDEPLTAPAPPELDEPSTAMAPVAPPVPAGAPAGAAGPLLHPKSSGPASGHKTRRYVAALDRCRALPDMSALTAETPPIASDRPFILRLQTPLPNRWCKIRNPCHLARS
jgi:hypothetical protein